MNVARQRPRKNITTKITKIKANIIVCESELIASLISLELSKIVFTSQSLGRVGIIFSNLACTSSIICTVLAPVCFCTITRTPRRPLIRSSMVAFSKVSMIVATSESITVRPPRLETTISRNTRESSNCKSDLRLKTWSPRSSVPAGTLIFSEAIS